MSNHDSWFQSPIANERMKLEPVIAAVPIRAVAPSPKLSKKTTSKQFIANLRTQNPSSSKKPNEKTKLGEREEKQNSNTMHNIASFDISEVPPPICTCTGVSRMCYKAGPGGWQSKCCTNSLSQYPLPLSPSKPGKRVSGRKMTKGTYRKVLRRLVKDGHDISHPVDLKNYWAKHGTNKFVTIK